MSRFLFFLTLLISLPLTSLANELGSGAEEVEGDVDEAHNIHDGRLAHEFTGLCMNRGISSKICREMVSPTSRATEKEIFKQLFGRGKEHILIPPQEEWDKGFKLAKLYSDVLKGGGICTEEVRNWFRPNKPKDYNAAVDGIRTSSHIDSNALDIYFCSAEDQLKAAKRFLAMRQLNGQPSGIRIYGKSARVIHISLDENIVTGHLADVNFDEELALLKQ